MTTRRAGTVLQHLNRPETTPHPTGEADGELLERFVRHRDAAAIEALVRRHAPMVWGVCRRILRNHHDAEDALQATFLVLMRRASSITPREMVANWLHGVARQTALKARQMAARRHKREQQVTESPEPTAPEAALWSGLDPLLDEELAALPEKYRVLLVLCDLEERTRREVAAQLGLPEGTIAGRLARARALLAARLTRRGLPLAAALVPGVLASEASAAVPRAAVAAAVHLTTCCVRGAVTGPSALLAEGVLRAMFVTKLKLAAVALLVFAAVGGAVWVPLSASGAAQHPTSIATDASPPSGAERPVAGAPAGDDPAAQRLWSEVGVKVERVRASAVRRAKADLGGGLKVLAVRHGSPAANARIEQDDIIVGLHLWETLSVDACLYILDQCREDEVTLPRCSLVRNGRTTHVWLSLPPEKPPAKPDAKEQTRDIVWGKEADGLQAGVGFAKGRKGPFRLGETVALVVVVRNVGAKPVPVRFTYGFPDENPPLVLDADGKPMRFSPFPLLGGTRLLVDRMLDAGAVVELGTVTLALEPVDSKSTRERILYARSGTYRLSYSNLPPTGKLSTGELTLEVADAQPTKSGEKSVPPVPGAPVRDPERGPTADEDRSSPTDLDALQGTWVLVAEEQNGVKRSGVAGSAWIAFKGQSVTMAWVRDDADRGPNGGITCTVDSTKNPKELTITGKGIKIQAIYTLEKDRLTIAHFGKPEDSRPKGFTPAKGDDNVLVVRVLERQKRNPPAPPNVPGGGPPPVAPKGGGAGMGAPPRTDKEQLQGTWVIASYEVDGKVDPAAQKQSLRLTIEGDRFTLRPELALHFPHGTFTLDAAKKPRTIDFSQIYGFPQEKPVLVPGIYELDGETLKICRATSGDKRPTEFTTKAGSGRELLVFRRPVADGAKKPDAAPPAVPPVSGLGFPPGDDRAQAPKLRDDPALKPLQGKWVLVKTEAQGKAQPAGENPFVKVIDGRKATLLKGEEVIWEGEFVLIDGTSKPARYDLKITSKRRLTDSPQYGIYELSGDELKTRSSASDVKFSPDTAAVARPKSFDTTGSSNATFFWTRQK